MAAIPASERQRILSIAREVRAHVDKKTGTFCPPSGFCGDAAIALSSRLSRAGINHDVVLGRWEGPVGVMKDYLGLEEEEPLHEGRRMHVWIEFPQFGRAILDVTADQYHRGLSISFPARRAWYTALEHIRGKNVSQLIEEEIQQGGKPIIPVAGPVFRRPISALRVRVREHLRHPSGACLCHRSKKVDRVRRRLVRRLA